MYALKKRTRVEHAAAIHTALNLSYRGSVIQSKSRDINRSKQPSVFLAQCSRPREWMDALKACHQLHQVTPNMSINPIIDKRAPGGKSAAKIHKENKNYFALLCCSLNCVASSPNFTTQKLRPSFLLICPMIRTQASLILFKVNNK